MFTGLVLLVSLSLHSHQLSTAQLFLLWVVSWVCVPHVAHYLSNTMLCCMQEAKGPAAGRIIKRPDLFVSDDLVTATWAQVGS
jgi:hypothetical protein